MRNTRVVRDDAFVIARMPSSSTTGAAESRAGGSRDNRNAKSGLKRKLRTGTLHSLCIGHHSKIRPCLRAGYCTGALADGRASDTGIPHSSFIIPRDTLPTGRVSACAVKGRMRIKSDEPPLLTCGLVQGAPLLTRGPLTRAFTTHHSSFIIHHSSFIIHHSKIRPCLRAGYCIPNSAFSI